MQFRGKRARATANWKPSNSACLALKRDVHTRRRGATIIDAASVVNVMHRTCYVNSAEIDGYLSTSKQNPKVEAVQRTYLGFKRV